MGTYFAFLRAINLGPTRKFPSADIRRVVEQAGFTGVATHVNSGNVRFDTTMRAPDRIAGVLETAFLADRGFEVPAVVFGAPEFAEIARDAAGLAAAHPEIVRHYVYLLPAALDEKSAAAVEARSSDAGTMVVRGRAAHALLGPSYTPGNVDPLNAARLLAAATARNAGVVRAIAEKWC